ncbi:hypothetical protein [Aneurinibacillus tyrosinisolvens]|uniref:hypothetical protein n=1 Tax=Aneurinibacillus tyrosinisolvens TaxID=1443435 RepID=UPI00063EE5FF|nr:hypothetical protein [Aneurinibacillus tyrosinisolvens]
MLIRKNERGSALLISIFLIVIFTILGIVISSAVINSARNVKTTEDHFQGKILAEMGVEHVQKELKKRFKTRDSLVNLDADPYIKLLKDGITITLKPTNNSYTIQLKTNDASFVSNPLSGDYAPYNYKAELISTGKPANGNSKPYILAANIYINTIPAAFHYAVSTPGELRLFGGSNVIGDVYADKKMVLSDAIRYKDSGDYKVNEPTEVPGGPKNKPYIQGFINIPKDGFQYNVKPTVKTLGTKPPILDYEIDSTIPPITKDSFARDSIKSLFLPLGDTPPDTGKITPNVSYEAGYEAPFIRTGQSASVASDFQDIINPGVPSTASNLTEVIQYYVNKPGAYQVISLNDSDFEYTSPSNKPNGFNNDSIKPLYFDINSTISNETDNYQTPFIRMAGNVLNQGIPAIYINSNGTKRVNVELGTPASFGDSTNTDPFTFDGVMYIKGNLDILGDIAVTGTIFVDGDVLINDINTLQPKNLVILSTGTITFEKQNTNKSIDKINPLNVFLYSEKNLELYAYDSVVKINGSIFGGLYNEEGSNENKGYIELNAKRDLSDSKGRTRLTIQFNQNIFDSPTKGLPSSRNVYVDIFELHQKTKED